MYTPLTLNFWNLVYATPAFIATVLVVGLLIYTIVQPRLPTGGVPFALFLFAVAVWSGCYAIEPMLPTLAAKVLVDKAAYLGIATLPPLWFIFVLVYRGSDRRVSALQVALLFTVPVFTILLVWTNNLHHLHWVRETLLTDVAPIPVFRADRGPWFYVNMMYSYSLLLGAAVLLLDTVRRVAQPYRSQAVMLLVASILPWVFNLTTILRLSPLPYLDLTPLGFAISSVLVAWSIFHLRLLEMVPAARGAVLDNIAEAVFVFDEEDRLLDVNRAGEAFLGRTAGEVIGRHVETFCKHPALLDYFRTGVRGQEEIRINVEGSVHWMDVRLSPWRDPQHGQRGRIVMLHDITGRKQADLDLRESEVRYRTLLDATFEGIVLTEQGTIVDMNERFEALLGIPKAHLLGRRMIDLTAPAFRSNITQHMMDVDYNVPSEIALVHARGQQIPVEIRSKTISYEGHPARVAAIRDLTRWKAAQAAEHEQRQLAEALRDVASALNSTLDVDTLLDRILENVYRVLPHSAANVMLIEGDGSASVVRMRGYDRWVDPATIGSLRVVVREIPGLQHMYETGKPLVIPDVDEYPGWHRWEATSWLRSYAAVPLTVEGQIVGFLNLDSDEVGFFQPEDVSRLQAFADQVAIAIHNAGLYSDSQQRNQQLALLNEITRAGISALDMSDLLATLATSAALIIDAEQSAILLTGPNGEATPVASSNAAGGSPVVLLTDEAGRCLAQQAVEAGKPLPLTNVPGEADVQTLLALPLLVESRNLGALLLGFDVQRTFSDTDLQWAQQAAGLMALAISRAQTVSQLHARNEELDAFNHTVAHDLKSPLHGMIASLELLERFDGENMSEDGMETLNLARRSARKLNQIIDGLLTLSRMRGEETVPQIVDVHSVVYGALARLDTQLQARNVRIRVDPDLPPALGQEAWLEEVFANLISNAIKYSGDDNPAPFITIFADAQEGCVRYAVRDNGLGIDKANQQRLFEMFARFHPRAAEGVGLGLSIVKRIVERLDGSVSVESEPGKGTTFYITLPAVVGAVPSPTPA